MSQTAETVWNRLTGTSLELEELQNNLDEATALIDTLNEELNPTPSLSRNLELERKIEEALKEARWDENPTTLSYNIIEAFRKNGLVIGMLPQ